MKTLKKYKIQYYFDGRGEVLVEARNEEEAKDKFWDGDIDSTTEKEWGKNYDIEEIKRVNETETIKERLEYFRQQIRKENISYEEIAELQSLAKYIGKEDIELLEWAGVKEKVN